MADKQNDPATTSVDGAGVHCGEHHFPTPLASEKQDSSGAPLHLIGRPKVVIETRGTSVFVRIKNPLWGDRDMEFLTRTGKPGRGALAYAEERRQRHAKLAWEKHKEREAAAEFRMAERIANARGFGGGQ